MWDTIVIGSGISGLTAAAALARAGQRVLVLEQHWVAGGLTQTFKRNDWTFAPGVHYISGVDVSQGTSGMFLRLLQWLSGGEEGTGPFAFVPLANPYDIVRVGEFEFGIAHPAERFEADLIARFPEEKAAIAAWFRATAKAAAAGEMAVIRRGLPRWFGGLVDLWKGRNSTRYMQLSVHEALAPLHDPLLRTVLGARIGDYGATTHDAPFLEHALVTGSYNGGAFYPVGGPAVFARNLIPTVRVTGGKVVLGADVTAIEVAEGRVVGVIYNRGKVVHREAARNVISTIGVHNTLARLPTVIAPQWREAVGALKPGPACFTLYLGFEGEISGVGASSANVWLYETVQGIERLWEDPTSEDAPALFASFPSLKDPAHHGKHTGEVIAFCSDTAFAPLMGRDDPLARDPDYAEIKAQIEMRLLAQFTRHWPALAQRIAFHELSTPLTQRRFVRTTKGSTYGLSMDAERLKSSALAVRTPIRGLLLAGQDVVGA